MPENTSIITDESSAATPDTPEVDPIELEVAELLDRDMPSLSPTVQKSVGADAYNRARPAIEERYRKLLADRRLSDDKAAKADTALADMTDEKSRSDSERQRLEGIIRDKDESEKKKAKAQVVTMLVISALGVQLGWQLNHSRSDLHSDGKGSRFCLEFTGGYLLTVIPHLEYLTVTSRGMKPQRVKISDGGITEDGWLSLQGFLFYEALEPEARQALPLAQHAAYYRATAGQVTNQRSETD